MAEKNMPLPRFGEWDVNNPASAEGFTVIFNKARDEKKTNKVNESETLPQRKNEGGLKPDTSYQQPRKNPLKWFCCG